MESGRVGAYFELHELLVVLSSIWTSGVRTSGQAAKFH
jgi:hypothetical protein